MLKPHVQVHNENGVMVAEFWDCLRLDPGAVQELRSKYEAHLKGGGRPELVVDLLGVGFAGSAALGHFVALHRFARPKNGRLIFCNVDPTVFEVFRVSKLDSLFQFAGDRPAALVLASSPAPPLTPTPPPADGTATPGSASPGRFSGGNGLIHSSRRKKLS
jgi:anti-anti-sigma factor